MKTHAEQNTHSEHISLEFGEVLGRAYKRFSKTFLPLLTLFGATILILISSVLFIGAISFGLLSLFESSTPVLVFVAALVILYVFIALYALMATGIMNTEILNKPTYDLLPLFKKSWDNVPRVFTVALIVQLAILGGIVLGILPGIWLGIVLMFAFTSSVLDKTGFTQAVSKSAHLVKNNFWNVFSFVLFIFLANIVLSIIPVVGSLISIVFSIFTSVLLFELYVTLHHNKHLGDSHVYHEKNIVLVTKLFAVCAIIAIISIFAIVATLVTI